jgi:hypothetical protein
MKVSLSLIEDIGARPRLRFGLRYSCTAFGTIAFTKAQGDLRTPGPNGPRHNAGVQGLPRSTWFHVGHIQDFPRAFKAIKGHSTLLKGFWEKNCLLFACHSGWTVKRGQAPVKGSQAGSSSVKQFGGKKRLFIFMNHPFNLYQFRPIPAYWDLFRTPSPPPPL